MNFSWQAAMRVPLQVPEAPPLPLNDIDISMIRHLSRMGRRTMPPQLASSLWGSININQ